jgi:hypothetical protein
MLIMASLEGPYCLMRRLRPLSDSPLHRLAANETTKVGSKVTSAASAERKFNGRDKAFLATVHQELAPMVGRRLAAAHKLSAMQLIAFAASARLPAGRR